MSHTMRIMILKSGSVISETQTRFDLALLNDVTAATLGQPTKGEIVANLRIEALVNALNRLACWEEGEVVTGAFDEPNAAKTARVALMALGLADSSV